MRISSDTFALRKWLLVRKQTLETRRTPFERLWRDLREHYEPALGHALKGDIDTSDDAALRDDEKIYNARTRILATKLAAGLQSGITNQSRQWFRFTVRDPQIREMRSAREYLGTATDITHDVINHSNIYPSLDQMYLRLGVFGQSAALIVPDDEADVRMIVIDEGAYWLAENRRGRVDTLMRRLRMTLSQMRDEFGMSALPQRMREQLEQGRNEEQVTVWNLVYPATDGPALREVPADRSHASVYFLDGECDTNQGILAVRSFDYNPIIAPRWSIRGQTVYGCGPGQIGLGEAKELQELELASLRLVEQESNPAMAVPSSMKGIPIDTGPGGIVSYDPIAVGGGHIPVQRLFETRQSVEAVQAKILEVEQRLHQIFYSDLFAMLLNLQAQGDPRTATEIRELESEKVSLLGPILTRLNTDLLSPLVNAVWTIVYDQVKADYATEGQDYTGLAEAPEELNGRDMDIKYTSTLHQEQEATAALAGPYRFLEFISGVAQTTQDPTIIDNIDADEMVHKAGEVLDSSGYLRNKDDVEQIRAGRMEQQQAQMQMQEAQRSAIEAKSVKDLAGAQLTDGRSALDIVAEGGNFRPRR